MLPSYCHNTIVPSTYRERAAHCRRGGVEHVQAVVGATARGCRHVVAVHLGYSMYLTPDTIYGVFACMHEHILLLSKHINRTRIRNQSSAAARVLSSQAGRYRELRRLEPKSGANMTMA